MALSWLLSFFLLLSPPIEPTINGQNTHIVNVLNPTSLEDIKNRYNAYDIIDGDLTAAIKFETDYNPYNCKVQTYFITVEVTNSRGNKRRITDSILVRDFIKPTIVAKVDEITLDISDNPTLNSLTKYFILEDNLNDDLKLCSDDFNKIFSEFNEGYLNFYTIDNSSNRSSTVTVLVKVIESCPKTIVNLPLKLTKKLSDEKIIELFVQNHSLKNDYLTANLTTFYKKAQKAGIYPAEIHFYYADNTEHLYQFKIDFSPIEETPKTPYMLIGFTAGVLIAGTVLIFIIKKHKRKQN